MSRQGKLFGEHFPVPARPDSPPQLEARRMVQPYAGKQAQEILGLLVRHGPMTREELCDITGIKEGAACGRLREMEYPDKCMPAILAGPALVAKVGRKKARSGVRVWLYAATGEGLAASPTSQVKENRNVRTLLDTATT